MTDHWPDNPGAQPPTGPPPSPYPPAAARPLPPPTGPPGGPPPGGSLPGGTPPAGGRRGPFLVVAVVVVALLVVAGAVWFVTAGDNETAAVESSPTTTEPPDTTTSTTRQTPGEIDPEFAAMVDDLEQFVEDERDLDFKEDVVVELLDDEAFVDRLLTDFDEDREELEQNAKVLQTLGLIEPGTDLAEALESLLGAGVLGFYDPETDELVVRGDETNEYVKQTIVHELTHALDDQWYELDRPELDDTADESGFAFSAVVEGNARNVEEAYEDTLSEDELEELLKEEFEFGAEADIDPLAIPPVLIDALLAPYELGEAFLDDVTDQEGSDGLDGVLETPPATSKEIMEPDVYLDGFEATAVDAPPSEGEVVDDGMFGQFTLELVLDQSVSTKEAKTLASVWQGDAYVVWEADGETCLRADFAFAGGSATADVVDTLTEWAADLPDAQVEDLDSGLVRLTSCVEGTAGGATSPG